MSTTKKETAALAPENTAPENTAPVKKAPAADVEVREEIFIPKGYVNDEPNLFVCVNGKSFLLPKGEKSTVPKYVADEIRRSWAAERAMDKRIAAMAVSE